MVLDSTLFEQITGVKSFSYWLASSICIDSRKVKKGDLFIAFKGENFNGNSFAKDALKKGAVACLVTELENKEDAKNYPLLLIKDPFKAIIQIAKYKRALVKGLVVAITGSYGKTTSKDMINTTLKNYFKISSTHANENNTLGAPLSLARMDLEDDLGVFEVGMNHKGEIDEIVSTLQPDIVLLNEIAPLHFENFTSLQEIVDAKLEILNGKKCKTLLVSKDDKNYNYIVKKAQEKGVKNILSYGFGKNAYCSLQKAQIKNLKYSVVALLQGKTYNFTLNTVALHNVKIALLVLTFCSVLGFDIKKAIKALEGFSVTKGRGNIEKTIYNGKSITVFNDSYNASGMKESLVTFANISANKNNILILGQMLELGSISKQKHEELAEPILNIKPSLILLVGKEMLYLQQKLSRNNLKFYFFNNVLELQEFLDKKINQKDFIFIKGSLGSKVYKIANNLLF